ncbi:MAG: hypothetical protein U0822_11335 [Anaerolineae bacterium]
MNEDAPTIMTKKDYLLLADFVGRRVFVPGYKCGRLFIYTAQWCTLNAKTSDILIRRLIEAGATCDGDVPELILTTRPWSVDEAVAEEISEDQEGPPK